MCTAAAASLSRVSQMAVNLMDGVCQRVMKSHKTNGGDTIEAVFGPNTLMEDFFQDVSTSAIFLWCI